MTYQQLLDRMYNAGNNRADLALGRMMDIVEEETGAWPNWDDEAPEWIIKNCLGA